MKIKKGNSALIKLERFIDRVDNYLKYNTSNNANVAIRAQASTDLAAHMLAYTLKASGLTLRWNKTSSIALFHLTYEELEAGKGKDPILNKAFKQIRELNEGIETDPRTLILEMADCMMNGRKAANKILAKLPRTRPIHPLKEDLKEIIHQHPGLNHYKIRQKLFDHGLEVGLIDEIIHESETISFVEHSKLKTLTFGTIQDWTRSIKNQNSSEVAG